MAGHISSVGEFDLSKEDWDSYMERVGFYLEANGITEATKKRATLLTVCGKKTYYTIRNLVAPKKPSQVDYADIIALAKQHYSPEPIVTVQRFKFNTRVKAEGESVAQYVEELRHIAIHCKYGDSLNDMLRDRLICGINNKQIQCRLLAEKKTDFESLLEIAQLMESAARDAKDLATAGADRSVSREDADIHKTSSGKKPQDSVRRNPQPQDNGRRDPRVHSCHRCGGNHVSRNCKFSDAVCHYCHKKGHLARVCRSRLTGGANERSQQSSQHTNTVHKEETVPEDVYEMFQITKQRNEPIYVTVTVHQKSLKMEIDTGAAVSIISERTYNSLWNRKEAPPLEPARIKLRTYTGEEVKAAGSIRVEVTHGQEKKQLSLIVAQGNGPSLLGRDWLSQLRLDWKDICRVNRLNASKLSNILTDHEAVFRDELGTIEGEKAKLVINPEVRPKFCKPRPVPFALRQKVEQELLRLEEKGIIQKVQSAEWAAPIVPIMKEDGTIRICGDYKVTANQAILVDSHPIPRIEELFAKMSGGVVFTKLDLSHAYLQLRLDNTAKKYLVINTHKGLYEYTRLPFGVSSAPAIFQRTMENLLQGLDHVAVYIDDILITGRTEEEHLKTLDDVLARLERAGMRLKESKCQFLLPSVEYLGHRISREGLQPTDEKVRAVIDAPRPTTRSQLKAFLGLINYYSKFIPNLSTILSPLYKLLQMKVSWSWSQEQEDAFKRAKSALQSPSLLVHYDCSKPLILSCDASPVGVGAVLAHQMEDGSERPISFVSRTLSAVERRYSQIDKEALAIVFGVKRYHQYLYGRPFFIFSDHKPLMYLFGETRGIPITASARVQRWALTLSGYSYVIKYRPGKSISNADGLSRLPLPTTLRDVPKPAETVLLMERLDNSLVTVSQVKAYTERDPVLSRVKKYILQGWPENITSTEMTPYLQRKDELSIEGGCILWGTRVLVPPQLRSHVLEEIHEGHPGIVRMKNFARSYVWWPSLNADLEEQAHKCTKCQQERRMPPARPMREWEWPGKPWTRLHIDHAGPFLGKILLIVVDAYSKWIEVHIVPSTSAGPTISKLRTVFATHGLPEILVSDNGTAFTSQEFKEFMERNGIRHVFTPPYHPASNGLAERAVRTVKEGLRKMEGPLEMRIPRFLLKYRLTPQSSTGTAPAELLMGRRVRTHLDLLYPSKHQKVEKQTTNRKPIYFKIGERVMARNFADGSKWMPGKVVSKQGGNVVNIELTDGRMWRRHVDHVIPNKAPEENTDSSDNEIDPFTMPGETSEENITNPEEINDESIETEPPVQPAEPHEAIPPVIEDSATATDANPRSATREPHRYSKRTRTPIDRYTPTF